MRAIVCIFAVVLVPALKAADGQPNGYAKRRGEWLQLRGDRALSGRSSIAGQIDQPQVLWKRFIGARESLLEVEFEQPQDSTLSLTAEPGGTASVEILRRWEVIAPAIDPDANEMPAPMGGPVGKFLPRASGLQRIQFDVADNLHGTCRLMARGSGKWMERWRSEPITDPMQGLNTITGDFDGDGELEIAFTPWHHLWVLDAATGKTEAKGLFYQEDALGDGRGYGWLGAFDVNGDGTQEFIIISDTQMYISVLGWHEERLELLWGRKYKSKSDNGDSARGTSLTPGTNPIQDVNGDGLPEIVVTSFDERRRDGRWWTEVIDARTGETQHALKNEQLVGLIDMNGNGRTELLCENTSGRELRLSLFHLTEGRLQPFWSLKGAALQTHVLPYLPAHVANGAAGGNVTMLTAGGADGHHPCFFTRASMPAHGTPGTRKTRITAWRHDGTHSLRPVGTITAPGADAIAARSSGTVQALVRTQIPGDSDRAENATRLQRSAGRVVSTNRIAAPLSPPLVGVLRPGAASTVVVQEAAEHVVAFQPPNECHPARLRWRRPGRGMHEGDAHRSGGTPFAGVNLVDVSGDGTLAVVLATRGAKDQARLVVLDPDAKELWHRDYDDLPGHPPGFTRPGLSFWFAGRYTDPGREDLIVATKSGVLTRLTLHDGRTGEAGWSQIAAGMYMASYDHDADGRDDALTTCWSEIRVLKGNTGQTLLHRNTAMQFFGGGKVWPADAYCCAADLIGGGRPQIIYWPAYSARGVVDMQGRLIWENVFLPKVPFAKNPRATHIGQNSLHPAIGDFDGDGQLELISSGDHTDQGGDDLIVRCYTAATGDREWELPLDAPAPARSAMSADIDNDGRDEALFTRGNTLCAVGTTEEGRAGEVRWRLRLPGLLGPPTIADVTGNGHAEILVVCSDGYVYCVGGTKRSTVENRRTR